MEILVVLHFNVCFVSMVSPKKNMPKYETKYAVKSKYKKFFLKANI